MGFCDYAESWSVYSICDGHVCLYFHNNGIDALLIIVVVGQRHLAITTITLDSDYFQFLQHFQAVANGIRRYTFAWNDKKLYWTDL